MQPAIVKVELFGMPRLVAGARLLEIPWVEGLTVAGVPAKLGAACPALRGRVVDAAGALAPGLTFNLNGRDFVRDPTTPLRPGDSLLLLSADAGG